MRFLPWSWLAWNCASGRKLLHGNGVTLCCCTVHCVWTWRRLSRVDLWWDNKYVGTNIDGLVQTNHSLRSLKYTRTKQESTAGVCTALYLLGSISGRLHVVLLALQLGVHGIDWIFVHQLGIQRQSLHHLHVQLRQLRVFSKNTPNPNTVTCFFVCFFLLYIPMLLMLMLT